MFHEPAAPVGKDPASPYKTRLGNWMFLLYAVIYAGFVAINLASPSTMEAECLWGLNLAVVYGFFLIIFALVLALIYTTMCSKKEAEMADKDDSKGRNA